MDKFTEAYIVAALWSTNDESTPGGGVPLDDNYTIADIHPDTLAVMQEDCQKFQNLNVVAIELGHDETKSTCTRDMNAGHDFWLNRNGHGCGFWDGDWKEPYATELDQASRNYGEFNLLVGDDGKIHKL